MLARYAGACQTMTSAVRHAALYLTIVRHENCAADVVWPLMVTYGTNHMTASYWINVLATAAVGG